MESIINIQLRWSDLDPNFHVRHSAYYDWGATARISFLTINGLTESLMKQLHLGPILFREECIFKKEIKWGDEIKVYLKLIKARQDFSRWSFQHIIYKNENILAAVITVDGAWLNTKERKLGKPTQEIVDIFSGMEKAEDFEWD